MDVDRVLGSFRDPSGFLYQAEGRLLRQVSDVYTRHFERLNSSGLYAELAAAGLLIPHSVDANAPSPVPDTLCVLEPEFIPHISYPYEWCFSQLKDAALLTLDIQQCAFNHGMTLKDASAYNVQFFRGRAIFIDTLSFEIYEPGTPWSAYRQFCQHFLAPLALMAHVDISLNQLFRSNIDGVPLPLAAKLLPSRTKLSPAMQMHIFMHARMQNVESKKQRGDDNKSNGEGRKFSETAFRGLIDSLRSAILRLEWRPGGSEWFDYYQANNNYSEEGIEAKEKLVGQLVAKVKPASVWDLGGNTGRFSRIAAAEGASVVCWDIDPGCVESNYRQALSQKETSVLPLLADLTNPGPALGWANSERSSITDRGPVDLVMALGLIHHLAIANNVPLGSVATFLQKLCSYLIIEFVPRGDSQIDKLMQSRDDIFTDYTVDGFEAAFASSFVVEDKQPVAGTKRILYLMRSRQENPIQ
jgi:ribosomal protein L11 methylase PrmA